jgi:hypothetical protein
MQVAVRDIREAVGTDDSESEVSAVDMLTAFVDAARRADSYPGALRAVLASVCDELKVESAALLGRHDGSPVDYRCLVAAGALDAAAPVVAADGFLITRLRAYPLPLPFAPTELAALAEWASTVRSGSTKLALAAAASAWPSAAHACEDLGGCCWERPRAPASVSTKDRCCARADQFALMINLRLTDQVVERNAAATSPWRRTSSAACCPTPRRVECADFAAISVPPAIGGDCYDFVDVTPIGIALASVSKGRPAALIMSVVQASLHHRPGDAATPCRGINFCLPVNAGTNAHFFYAQLTSGRQLRYVNAGHNAPYLLRAGRPSTGDSVSPEIEQLSVGGTVVGMFPYMDYEEATVELRPGDVLLAFTDGVPEAHNPEDEEFGDERLQQLLRQTAHLPADEISARISAEMKDWIRDAEQYDDLTFIVMKVR